VSVVSDEFARIAIIAEILRGTGRDVELGIGDDAAVLAPSAERMVITIDAVVDGVHFRRDWMSWEDVGYRATVAAASDVLAMGARPTAAVAAWTLPDDLEDEAVAAIARGQKAAADALGMTIVGGNLASAPILSITTTACGTTPRPIGRSGARPGDALILRGAVGEAALGIAALRAGRAEVAERGVSAYRRPRVLLAEARELATVATAMIDVSDGLAQDIGHLARASGVRAVIDSAALARRREPSVAEGSRVLGVDPLQLELAGGDDYALVGTGRDDGEFVIGHIEEGEGVLIERGGHREPAPIGYRHGSTR
jgi:thiamine-monophosphate kinase